MIASITLKNFFSFGQQTRIELSPGVNILLGINGSGKTNFGRALHLLHEAIAGEGLAKLFLGEWGGFSSVANFSTKESDEILLSFEFDREALKMANPGKGFAFPENPIYELRISKQGENDYFLKEKFSCGKFFYMKMNNAKGSLSTRDEGKVQLSPYPPEDEATSLDARESVLRQISDPQRFHPLFTLKSALAKTALYNDFDTSPRSPLRGPAKFDPSKRLLPNGENLCPLILNLKNQHLAEYDELERYVRQVNPHFKDISFSLLGPNAYLTLRENGLSRSVSLEHVSNGTLRYLLLLAIMLNPKRGSLLVLDEPETGLHPDMIASVVELLKKAAQNGTQFFVATHSPLLVNGFDLEDILIFEKNEQNESVVSMKSEDDFEESMRFKTMQSCFHR